MLSLIIDSRHPKGQKILRTLSMHGIDPADASVLEFDKKRSVLKDGECEGSLASFSMR